MGLEIPQYPTGILMADLLLLKLIGLDSAAEIALDGNHHHLLPNNLPTLGENDEACC